MSLQKIVTQLPPSKYEEQILVIPRGKLFELGEWQGIKTERVDEYQALVRTHAEFHPRGLMEEDERYKQVIPYLIFMHQDQYFMMQRSDQASEQRLQNKLSLGIGGHIRHEDIVASGDLFGWARREFHEEVTYNGNLTIETLGILNDDSNAVGRVHVGFVLLLIGDSDTITVKSELKEGSLVPLETCIQQYDRFENWSKLIINQLKAR